jgi:hypothetical protein
VNLNLVLLLHRRDDDRVGIHRPKPAEDVNALLSIANKTIPRMPLGVCWPAPDPAGAEPPAALRVAAPAAG